MRPDQEIRSMEKSPKVNPSKTSMIPTHLLVVTTTSRTITPENQKKTAVKKNQSKKAASGNKDKPKKKADQKSTTGTKSALPKKKKEKPKTTEIDNNERKCSRQISEHLIDKEKYVVLPVPKGSFCPASYVLPKNQVYMAKKNKTNQIECWVPVNELALEVKEQDWQQKGHDSLITKLKTFRGTTAADFKAQISSTKLDNSFMYWYQVVQSMMLGGTFWEKHKKTLNLARSLRINKKGEVSLLKKPRSKHECYTITSSTDLESLMSDARVQKAKPKKTKKKPKVRKTLG